jgi:sterol 3beta-glucosyltransferase
MEFPDRLKEPAQKADAEETLRPAGYGHGAFLNMNQSIFGLIAAAGSQADFSGRFESQSSEDEDDDDDDRANDAMSRTVAGPRTLPSTSSGARGLAQTTVLQRKGVVPKVDTGSHRKKISESLFRSVSSLARLGDRIKSSKSDKSKSEGSDESIPLPGDGTAAPASNVPAIEITRTESRTAPVMSRMLEARAEMESRPSFDGDRTSKPAKGTDDSDVGDSGPTELAKKLAEIFHFDQPEEVIEEYPCWLLQHVLLQGYMYITARHIAFYAYLPKKAVRICTNLTCLFGSHSGLLTVHSMRSQSPGTCPSVGNVTPSTTATGSA